MFGSNPKTPSPLELKAPTDLTKAITNGTNLVIRQRRELTELFLGIETRNQYMIYDQDGAPCGSIVERSTGIGSFLKRIFLGSHRPFVIDVFDASGKQVLELSRPFFFFFSDLIIRLPHGALLGTAHRRFGILNKIYELRDHNGQNFAQIRSSVFKIWTFAIRDERGEEVARISKRWSGLLKEYFTDTDNFMVEFGTKQWHPNQRALIFATAISVDFDFFEGNNKK